MSGTITAKAVIAALLLCCTAYTASADTWIFRDVSRPHGHERSMKAKFADAHKCGATGHQFADAVAFNFTQCMLAHGWVRDHVVPDPAPRFKRNAHRGRSYDEELEKRNRDASDDAERQRDEQSRSDDFQRQMQDQINTDAAISNLNNGQ